MNVLRDLLSSKKFMVFLASALVLLASKIGLDLDEGSVDRFLALAASYILGQGIADKGKEAAKINTGIATSPVANAMKVSLIVAILVTLGACGTQTSKMIQAEVDKFGHQVVDCSKEAIQDFVIQAVPTVETAAVTGWKAGLDAIVRKGEAELLGAGWCSIHSAIDDLRLHIGSVGAEGNESVGIANLSVYLKEHQVVFK